MRAPVRRFGVFEVDPETGELRKQGRRVRIADQSIQVLLALLDRPGEVVTREELRHRLWPDDTFVDFDANLNTAVSLLREALGDSAKSPRFIETLPRRGYRFLVDVVDDRTKSAPVPSKASSEPPHPSDPPRPPQHRRAIVAVLSLAVLSLIGLSYQFTAPPSQTIGSLAVLPLVYAGPQQEDDQEYLADGMTSALITRLAGFGVPNVISETSVMRYKGARKPLPVIARELGADLIVEGSVQKEGNTLRINAQLVDGRTDKHLWARSYERELDSILVLQDDIATAIAREIGARLALPLHLERPVSRTVNPQAHEAYLRGRYALRNAVGERLGRARDFFEEAIRLDPSFAPAYAGLADYYGYTDALPPSEAQPRAKRYALEALRLDERLAGAHLSLALASMWGDWDWKASQREFERSLALDPSDATSRRWYSLFLDLMGRPRAALSQAQRVRELDPISPATYQTMGYHLFMIRRYDESLAQFRALQEQNPHDPRAFEGLGTVYIYKGDPQRAIAAAEEAIALWGRDPGFVGALAVARARAGQPERARVLLNELHQAARQRYIPPSWFAMIHMNLGEIDRAFQWLDAAFEKRDTYLVHLRASPLYDAIRGDKRYADMVRRMNFPPPEDAGS